MEKIVEQNLLYDFYGELLNEHRRKVYELAVFEDWSLSEIGQECGISRQGVHDLLRRCNRMLEEYEDKLKLMDKFLRTKDKMIQIHQLTCSFKESNDQKLIDQIESIAKEMIEEL